MIFVQEDGAVGNGAGLILKVDFYLIADEHVTAGHQNHMALGFGFHGAVIKTHMIGRQAAVTLGDAHVAHSHVALGAVIVADFIGGDLPGKLRVVLGQAVDGAIQVLSVGLSAGHHENAHDQQRDDQAR